MKYFTVSKGLAGDRHIGLVAHWRSNGIWPLIEIGLWKYLFWLGANPQEILELQEEEDQNR